MKRTAILIGLGWIVAVAGCSSSGLTHLQAPLAEPAGPVVLDVPAEVGTDNVWLEAYTGLAAPDGPRGGHDEGFVAP